MEKLFEQGLVEKYEGERHVSYILNDSSLFFPTGLKAIQNEKNQGILKCIQIKFNGKDKLIYLTEGYQKLKDMLPVMKEETFVKIAKNFISIIKDLQEDSFLKCSHIDFNKDRIFIDPATCAVYLVYLPIVDSSIAKLEFDFNQGMKKALFNWILHAFSIPESSRERYIERLSDEKIPVEAIFQKDYRQMEEKIKEEKLKEEKFKENVKEEFLPEKEKVRLRLYNQANGLEFVIDQDEFILGKSPYRADGRIEGNIFVGNTHCKIIRSKERYFVVDLESKNGTLLNGMKLTPKKEYAVKQGDVLTLANLSFSADEIRGV